MNPKSGDAASSSRPSTTTISIRLAAASAGVIILTFIAFVLFGVVRERRAISRIERETAEVLLDHLVSMLGPGADPDEACLVLASVGASQDAAGRIQLVVDAAPPARPSGYYLAASRNVMLASGEHRLEYYASALRMHREVRANVIAHGVLGLAAVVWLVYATEMIVRRRLVEPLHAFAHQIRHVSRGGGWLTQFPDVDGELSELKESFSALGPALGEQVSEWIAVERRSAIALEHHELRVALKSAFEETGTTGAGIRVLDALARIEHVLTERERAAWPAREAHRRDRAPASSNHYKFNLKESDR